MDSIRILLPNGHHFGSNPADGIEFFQVFKVSSYGSL